MRVINVVEGSRGMVRTIAPLLSWKLCSDINWFIEDDDLKKLFENIDDWEESVGWALDIGVWTENVEPPDESWSRRKFGLLIANHPFAAKVGRQIFGVTTCGT
jgi:hypothetical protein